MKPCFAKLWSEGPVYGGRISPRSSARLPIRTKICASGIICFLSKFLLWEIFGILCTFPAFLGHSKGASKLIGKRPWPQNDKYGSPKNMCFANMTLVWTTIMIKGCCWWWWGERPRSGLRFWFLIWLIDWVSENHPLDQPAGSSHTDVDKSEG